MKKSLSVFRRDLKIVLKDPMALWMILAPLLLSLIIVAVSPGIQDSTIKIACNEEIGTKRITALKDFARIESYQSIKAVEERVLRRDEVIGLVKNQQGIEIIAQGNESENSIQMVKVLNTLYETGALNNILKDSRVSFLSFKEKIPRLKLSLAVALILMITVISAMITVLGLVDEKTDKTIKAANVTPIKQSSYILSKSIIGILALIFASLSSLLILGMTNINWLQMTVMILSCSSISIIIAFVIGLASSDFIEAAGSVKGLMVPLMASILVYELAPEKWHWTVMWSPFFWAYKGITAIVNNTATWPMIGMYTGIILVISLITFAICLKNIRKLLA